MKCFKKGESLFRALLSIQVEIKCNCTVPVYHHRNRNSKLFWMEAFVCLVFGLVCFVFLFDLGIFCVEGFE